MEMHAVAQQLETHGAVSYNCNNCGEDRATADGLARDGHGRYVCFACCAKLEIELMTREGKIDLFLQKEVRPMVVTNWPTNLRFVTTYLRRSFHNWCGTRLDVWFQDRTGRRWHGVCVGNTDTVHCRRLKDHVTAC